MAKQNTQAGTVGTDDASQNQSGSQNLETDGTDSSQEQGGDGGSGGTSGGDDGQGKRRSIDGLPKWAQDLIRETREEAAQNRVNAKKREEDARKEALSDIDRKIEEAVEKERGKLSKRFTDYIVRARAEAALAEANFANPSSAIKLLDLDDVEVEEDDKGNFKLKGLDKAVKAVAKEFPQLVGSGTNPNVGNSGTAATGPTMDDFIRGNSGKGYSEL